MLLALCLSVLTQSPQVQAANTISRRPALPALAAKAPGKPEYGLHLTSPQGQFVFTNLSYTPATPKGSATLYRVTGPGGLGPYRLGADLKFASSTSPIYVDGRPTNSYQTYRWFDFVKVLEGGAAKEAGLDKSWHLLEVDGQDFGWDPDALMTYLTHHPVVEALAFQRNFVGGQKAPHTFRIRLHRQDLPANPTEEQLVPEQATVLQPQLNDPRLWSELVALRSALPRFSPLPVDLGGKLMWAVRGTINPQPSQGEQPGPITLEFWGEDPTPGPRQNYPAALWVEPADGLRQGRVFQVEDHWYQIQQMTVEVGAGRLLNLALRPWVVDVMGLLAGASPAQVLGPGATLSDREALEESANGALLEWKTLTLPAELVSQDLRSVGNLVVRLEKGLLKLDLEGKGIRARLDAQARAEAERKAALEIPGKGGGTVPAATPPASESERLADLLEQRKAILMAILGSAKQALSNLRR